ncbi:MAG: DUF3795 domain-containing protein [Anaerolineae bacterium]|nr:DUF3795 domain-containing protein [Anaerolineae bacterium]
MIAYCGLSCGECPAYVATQAGDMDALEKVLVRWSTEFNAPHISMQDMLCDGCTAQDSRLNGYCRQCKIRACAVERRLESCAACDEYACATLARILARCEALPEYWAYAWHARKNLEGIRAGLAG